MTSSQFDKVIDRTEFPTLKWSKEQIHERFGNREALPFWVADMDFQTPDVIVESLLERAKHGIYGYEYKKDSYDNALISWYSNRHDWQINPEHIEDCPTVLNAVSILINQHSEEGDGIIIQPPVFFEFGMVIKSNNRQRVKNPLKLVDGKYQIDFEDLEAKASDPKNKILIICNPHNPIGRVWTKEELTQMGDICLRHNVLVISDEIHGEVVYSPHKFTPFASISEEFAQNSVTCLSPAKTFNIAGTADAMAVIPNEKMREQFHDFAHRYQINKTNVFAKAAVETAYGQAGDWLDELVLYLQSNIDFLRNYLAENIPQVKLIEPEGTFLIWLDFNELGLDAKELEQFLGEKAQIAVNAGYWFGREGAGYARMNIACSQEILEEGLARLKNAVLNDL